MDPFAICTIQYFKFGFNELVVPGKSVIQTLNDTSPTHNKSTSQEQTTRE